MKELRSASHGRLDRSMPVRFTFDGRAYQGYLGDTLASALLANGVHLLGRSFKYHRPRGLLSAGADEPNALVTVIRDAARSTPNVRATQVELYDGLVAISQNRWPSLGFDIGGINGLLSPLFPAGFYYKTFMWPRSFWHRVYEPRIRAAAGLGKAPVGADPDRYAQRFAHCDVLVVGAGPAGLLAALSAAQSGASVMLCDEQPEMGGSLLDETSAQIAQQPASAWLATTLAQIAALPNVTLLPRTTAFGYFPHNNIGLCERITDHLPDQLAQPSNGLPRERLWQVRAKEVVLATGAIERPLVFPGNDRPGVMLAGAARTYLNRYGVRVGTRIVVLAGCDAAYAAALDLRAAGVDIAVIADVRPVAGEAAMAAARAAGLRVMTQATALGTSGRLRVSSIQIAQLNADGSPIAHETIACDAVLMSGGYTPSVHLFSQSRGKLSWRADEQFFVPGSSAEHERSAGACRGTDGLAAVLHEGAEAGAAAAAAAGHSAKAVAVSASVTLELATRGLPGTLAQPEGRTPAKAFVDWQNDVTTRDLELAMREGFQSIEHIKRYTTTGMATDQGKTSNMNALAFIADRGDRQIPAVGLTTFRMPYTPVSFGILAGYDRGDRFDPVRRTPTHGWAAQHGAVFEDVGMWKRARYFPRGNEDMHAAVDRECLGVRRSVGMFEASTLGKIEVVGPDATEFMNRIYANNWTSLAVGKSRYGVLLRDDGFVYDDGVVARLEDRYHVTTTTGGAARVMNMMEDYRQTEWPQLKVWLTSTTEQWAVVAVQGPRARDVLSGLVSGIDLSPAALPHMSVARGTICGVPLLLFRVSFTGELGFEVNVPSDYGQAVWEAIYAAGQAHDITVYGTEAMHVLRAEKGYIIVGQETDGTATPDDVGLGWAVANKKPDFVGKRGLMRPAMQASGRKQLVGLRTADPKVVLDEGSQVVETAGQPVPMKMIGHVTSAYASANLGHSIALAMVSGGRARIGQTLYVPTPQGEIAVTVTEPIFYDPQGARLNG